MTHYPPPMPQPPNSWQQVPAPVPAQAPQQRPASALPWALVAVFVATTVVFAVLFFAGVGKDGGSTAPAATDQPTTSAAPDAKDPQSQRAEALKAAEEAAVQISTFDYRDLDANTAAVVALSTEQFASKYEEMAQGLREIVASGQGRAEGTVTDAAVKDIDESTATVLLFVDQKAYNSVSPEGRNQPYRMIMTLKLTDGRWLVDDLKTV